MIYDVWHIICKLKLSIITLKGIEFEDEIVSLNLKTTSGEITVLDYHRPLMTSLEGGQVKIIKKKGENIIFKVGSGFLEVGKDNTAIILAD